MFLNVKIENTSKCNGRVNTCTDDFCRRTSYNYSDSAEPFKCKSYDTKEIANCMAISGLDHAAI